MILTKTLPWPAIAHDAQGLFRELKSLPPKLFYDEAGSALFERITLLPEYYLTRAEAAILHSFAPEIAAAAGPVASLVELGAGTSEKTRILIAALRQARNFSFVPVDISAAPLGAGQLAITREFPQLRLEPIVADFTRNLSFLQNLAAPRLVLYLGSSIGNFDPMPATAFLGRLRRELQPGDALLLGTDLRKSPAILLPAYNDKEGVTAAFNKNILARLNRELGAHFDLKTFRHVARWNDCLSRIELYLESTVRQSVRISEIHTVVELRRGELIHTENSYKFTNAMVATIFANAGFVLEQTWTDERGWFADHLARVPR